MTGLHQLTEMLANLEQLEQPLEIDAIRCRLRQDVDARHLTHNIPTPELKLLLDIVDAARHCVREWEPTATDKRKGRGTGVGMRAAEDRLIMAVRSSWDRGKWAWVKGEGGRTENRE